MKTVLAPHQPLDSIVQLPNLLGAAARPDRLGHAVLRVVGEELKRNALERRPGRVDLGEDVDAVPVLLNHLLNPAHLTLDAPKPRLDSLLILGVTWHLANIPPMGIFAGEWHSMPSPNTEPLTLGRCITWVKPGRVWKIAAAAAAVLVIGGLGAYEWIVLTRPPELGLASGINHSPAPSPAAGDPLAEVCRQPAVPGRSSSTTALGLWVVQPGSVAGYRAHEKFAQLPSPHVAVARTDQVSGWLLVGGTDAAPQIETACVAVRLAGLRSVDQLPGFNTADRDESARDFLHVAAHPYAVFQPYPSPIDPAIARGGTFHMRVAGALELNGTSRPATFAIAVRFADQQAAGAGNATVDVADFGIDVPQTAGDFVAVTPQITLEVSLVLLKP